MESTVDPAGAELGKVRDKKIRKGFCVKIILFASGRKPSPIKQKIKGIKHEAFAWPSGMA